MVLRSTLFYYLLIAPHVLLVGLLVALHVRKLRLRHPIFFTFVAYEILIFPVVCYLVFSKSITTDQYWRRYIVFLVGSVCLRFGVIYELFSNLSKTYPSLGKFTRYLFRAMVTIFLFIALSLVAFSWPGNLNIFNRFITYVLDRGVNLLQLALLLTLFGIAKFFGLSWRKYVFGITLGFAIYLSVQLIATAVEAQWGYMKVFDYLTMAAFHVSVVVWLLYVLVPEQKPILTSVLEHADMKEWTSELEKLIKK